MDIVVGLHLLGCDKPSVHVHTCFLPFASHAILHVHSLNFYHTYCIYIYMPDNLNPFPHFAYLPTGMVFPILIRDPNPNLARIPRRFSSRRAKIKRLFPTRYSCDKSSVQGVEVFRPGDPVHFVQAQFCPSVNSWLHLSVTNRHGQFEQRIASKTQPTQSWHGWQLNDPTAF
jgi:hypothetical protein